MLLDAAVEAVVTDLLAGDRDALAATRRLVRQLTPPALSDRLADRLATARDLTSTTGRTA